MPRGRRESTAERAAAGLHFTSRVWRARSALPDSKVLDAIPDGRLLSPTLAHAVEKTPRGAFRSVPFGYVKSVDSAWPRRRRQQETAIFTTQLHRPLRNTFYNRPRDDASI